jgi:competence protein ComEC
MQSKGIDVTGNISRQSQIAHLGKSKLPLFASLQINMQESFSNSLDKLFPGTEGSLLKAMLLGEKQFLPKDVREAYFATGLAHLMAVSGLHIGFVAAAAYFLIWPAAIHGLYRIKPRWALAGHARTLTAFLCILPVLYYMILAGPKISALRAGIMVILGLFAILAHRLKNMFNALLLAAFFILLQDPLAIMDVSFQLSFTATLAILLVISQITKTSDDPVDRMGEQSWLNRNLKGPSPLREDYSSGFLYAWDWTQQFLFRGAIISSSAILSTLPILIFHFHQISLAGFFLNLLMVPLTSLLIPLALLVITIGIVAPFFAGLIALPVLTLVKIFLWVPLTFAALPFSSLYIATPPWFWFVLYYLIFLLVIIVAGNESLFDRFKQSALLQAGAGVAMAGLILWLAFPRFPGLANDKLQVTFLDVGQGESIFIEFPNRQTLLIDGGGFYKNIFDVGRYVVAPFLWHQGVQKIDYMAVTHSDNDHIRGLESLIQLFPVGNFFDPPAEIRDARIDKLRAKMLRNNAGLLPLKTGESLTVGEVRLTPLHPEPGFPDNHNEKNNNDRSMVLRLEYKDFKLLLTGDISEKAEQILLDSGAPLQADFLKSPHHGSRFSNSPAFIEAVNPQAVFFFSGYLNRMHHPHPETLKRFQEKGSNLWRTDLHGAIQISTDGHRHQIKTHADL